MNLTAARKHTTRRAADLAALDTLKAYEAARPLATAGAYEFVGFKDGLATYRTSAPAVAYDIPRPTATRTVRVLRAAVIVLLIAVATLATVTGVLLTHHDAPTPASNSTSVSSFNDGFATSKQDDCQQGDANACAWLKSN